MSSTLINNIWHSGDGEQLTSTRPDESKILWQKNASSIEQVKLAVDCAKNAYNTWGYLKQGERTKIIKNFAEILNDQKGKLAKAIVEETGKPHWEATGEVTAMANKVAISIRAQEERSGRKEKDNLRLRHQAHGVMAVFGPFNFPGHLPNGHIVPALLAGNSIVFKPSELTPLVAEITASFWLDAGLPAGVLNLVQGGREVGGTLVGADIDGLLFTGSSGTGKTIHKQLAGRPQVLLALEMGGNNAMIVAQAQNLDVCANTIIHSAFLSAGQRCTCTRRLILVKNDSTELLVSKIVEQAKRIVVNTPDIDDEQTPPFMGPVINMQAAKQVQKRISDLLSCGGKPLLTMETDAQASVYLSPTIVDVSQIKQHLDEETFGPLLQIDFADNFQQALRMANNTKYGLAAGLLSDNNAEQEQFINTIRAGVVSINAPTAGASSELPFGGVGDSGNHRPSAYYATDYCAWPQSAMVGDSTSIQAETLQINAIRGLK